MKVGGRHQAVKQCLNTPEHGDFLLPRELELNYATLGALLRILERCHHFEPNSS